MVPKAILGSAGIPGERIVVPGARILPEVIAAGRERSLVDEQTNGLKWLIIASTAAIVIAGDTYGVLYKQNERGEANAVFFGFLVALLLPTVIFTLGVRQARSVYVYGSLLFGLTAAAWLPVFVSGGDLAFYVPFAWLVTLVTSMVGASRDRQESLSS